MTDFHRAAFAVLSPHFTLAEATHSQEAARRGIDNVPDDLETLQRIRQAAQQMEIVRELIGDLPIQVSSWYRCPRLNEAVGSGPTSAHLLGLAVDFIAPQFGSPAEIARHLAKHAIGTPLRFDQLICEGTWVHISFLGRGRGQLLTAIFIPGRPTAYVPGLPTA